MKNNTYTQCLFRKGYSHQVSWIPTKYAKKGNIVRLKTNGEWENGWIVEKTMSVEIDEIVLSNSREYLKHRTVTDV